MAELTDTTDIPETVREEQASRALATPLAEFARSDTHRSGPLGSSLSSVAVTSFGRRLTAAGREEQQITALGAITGLLDIDPSEAGPT